MTEPVQRWYTEPVLPTLHHKLELKSVLYSGRTSYQTVQIIDTNPFGVTLVLDGKTQSAGLDEFIYHEALVHPALIAHPEPRTVFIAGGGEGATLRETLAHRTVERAVMVDLDRELVELCKERLSSWHQGSFADPRSEVIFGDARSNLEGQPDHSFDAIIVDVTDPSENGLALSLFTRDFYTIALRKLRPNGVLATQAGPAAHGMESVFTTITRTIASVFGFTQPYAVEILSFGSNWGFVIAGPHINPDDTAPNDIDRRIKDRVSSELRFYDSIAHNGIMALPKWLRSSLKSQTNVIETQADVPTIA